MERDKSTKTIEEKYRQIYQKRYMYIGDNWHSCQPIVIKTIARADETRWIRQHTTG